MSIRLDGGFPSYVLNKAAGAVTKALESYGGLSSEWSADQLDFVAGLVFLVLALGYTYYCSGPIRQELEPAHCVIVLPPLLCYRLLLFRLGGPSCSRCALPVRFSLRCCT